MSGRVIAGLLTVAILALVLGIGPRRPAAGPGRFLGRVIDPSQTPEDRLRKVLDDARAGDVDSYLDAYAGSLRSRIEREVNERGRTTFAAELRRAAASRKGHALFAPEADGPDAVRIAVESIYPDRNERQVYRLERGPDGWRIAGVESARTSTPTARFGAPATYNQPEGVPVDGYEPSESAEESGP